MPPATLLVTTTTDTQERAREMARTLIAEKLAACIEIHEIQSIYPWKGKICDTPEWVLSLKTSTARYEALQARIQALHTYELPQIIAVPITHGLPGYLDWVCDETKAS